VVQGEEGGGGGARYRLCQKRGRDGRCNKNGEQILNRQKFNKLPRCWTYQLGLTSLVGRLYAESTLNVCRFNIDEGGEGGDARVTRLNETKGVRINV